MTEFLIAPIVEGHGEVEAVPILLRRLLDVTRRDAFLKINHPIHVKPASMLGDRAYFARYLELAARKVKAHPRGSVLILLDCEDDCPKEVGQRLAAAAAAVRPDVRTTVALAHREFETWFLAAARSLRGVAGLPADLEPPPSPESLRDAKGWLHSRMEAGYNEPNHQPALTKAFSFEEASMVDSFARLRRKFQALYAA